MIPVFEVTEAPASCPASPIEAIDLAIAGVDRAWDRHDDAGFESAARELSSAVSCLEEVPAQNQIARVHQTMALVAFVGGEMGPARRSMLTARKLEPGWKLQDDRFPPAHPFVELYRKATHPGEYGDLPIIAPESWIVDGLLTSRAPAERAFLLQVTRDSKVVWSGYAWELTDVPERAAVPRDWRDPPHTLQLGAVLSGGARLSRQTVADGPLADRAWDPERGGTPTAGMELVARWTPLTLVGGELSVSVLGPSDPVEGGGADPALRAVARIGGAGWAGDLQPYAAARLGGGLHPFRAWTTEGVAEVWTLPSVITGLEAGLRTDRERLGTVFDADLVFDAQPVAALSSWRAQIDGGVRIRGPLALEGLLGIRREALPFVDPDATRVGLRTDLDLRLGAGVALWY